MASEQVARNLETIKLALEEKGFNSLSVTHYFDTPRSHVLLHDDHGQVARGDVDQIVRAIEAAGDLDRLWSGLDRAGLTTRSLAAQP